MNSEKLISLVKQFREIERAQKDLDFRKAQWAREARGCFVDDRRFIAWCKADVGLTDPAAQDLCLLARAAGIVPDPKTWIRLGGSREIREVSRLPTKRQQIDVLEAAKATGRAVRALVKERMPANDIAPVIRAAPRKMSDAEVLARFIAENVVRKLPPEVEMLVRMYAPREANKRAA